jgi:hypothetical protein
VTSASLDQWKSSDLAWLPIVAQAGLVAVSPVAVADWRSPSGNRRLGSAPALNPTGNSTPVGPW